jgi:hypothetical protein
MKKLTKNNYYSDEANKQYMSASFVKSMLRCEAATMAELTGEWKPPPSTALLVGSYVDSYFEGPKSFDTFVESHPEILKRDGTLKSEYVRANQMIERAYSEPVFMQYMKGQKQKIVTGEIMGIPFKAKFDVYRKGERIVDLKTTQNMESKYRTGEGKMNPILFWGWDIQMALYAELEGHDLPTYLAIITKEDPPNLYLVEITKAERDACMEYLYQKLPRFDAIKRGLIEPERCEKCAYCRATKRLTKPITIEELDMEF